jgi:hypothetical protein
MDGINEKEFRKLAQEQEKKIKKGCNKIKKILEKLDVNAEVFICGKYGTCAAMHTEATWTLASFINDEKGNYNVEVRMDDLMCSGTNYANTTSTLTTLELRLKEKARVVSGVLDEIEKAQGEEVPMRLGRGEPSFTMTSKHRGADLRIVKEGKE